MNAQKLGINVNELKKVPGLLSLFERSHISPDGMVLPRDPILKVPTQLQKLTYNSQSISTQEFELKIINVCACMYHKNLKLIDQFTENN